MEIINHEYYVSLEVAKLLKEVGFKWGCRAAWDLTFPNEPYLNHAAVYPTDFNNDVDDILYAPTLDVAQRWLREVKNYDVFIVVRFLTNREYIARVETDISGYSTDIYKFYEEAQEAGIKKALEIIL